MEFTKEQNLYAEIVQKAWEDDQFKSELLANPIPAIEKLTGQKPSLPQGKTLVVRDQTDESIVYINIPAKFNTEDVELNEDQLETVAGGAKGIFGPSDWTAGPFIEPLILPGNTRPVNPSNSF
ncbi:NHLP leader peptide family RiPP precursor [Spirosoma oryzicola]|uniref:NHLP leader peptide family RiPP precursor n=1 Tax=Spirosoma oryzicola TaxID=2898794 RepID=UPI001E3E2679|nr:NHLP leader peptide family RiPP precursor [Spirosoma oryzicola]UHG94885.1 NHLP leader peptide family RiPP precursor [Spirosoma oryzicola]